MTKDPGQYTRGINKECLMTTQILILILKYRHLKHKTLFTNRNKVTEEAVTRESQNIII